MIDCIGVIYIENEAELSLPIRSGAIYDENQTGQQHDQSNGKNPNLSVF